MEIAFHSAGQLKAVLKSIGYEMEISQLSIGPLAGCFRLGGKQQGAGVLHQHQSGHGV